MRTSFTVPLGYGYSLPPRKGDRINTWGSKINECARKLDAMDLPPAAVAVLRELFEEIGQQARDYAGEGAVPSELVIAL